MEKLKIDFANGSVMCSYYGESIELDGDMIPKSGMDEMDGDMIPKTGVGGMSHVERYGVLEAKHKVFLSHSGVQKDFVEQLCVDLERWDRYPFFDKRQSSLPIGEKFPNLIFEAIEQCEVGVLLFSKEFFSATKWPMLELVAMVREVKKRGRRIKIISVLFFMSWEEWSDEGNRGIWISKWEEWADEDKRIDVEEWKEALRVLKPMKSMVMEKGRSAMSCREEIVKVVCEYVLPETRWDDSHIKGKMRLCEYITKKIDDREVRKGIQVMGLLGMGGMGKTSICKAMCNELFRKFKGRVCHIEMESGSEVELLRGALRKLTSTRVELLDKLDIGECRDQLRRCVVNEAVFLALDNVSDSIEVIRQARTFLGARWGEGSVILVTARSLGELMCLRQYISESDCVEMPELEEAEAKCVFRKHAGLEEGGATEVDEGVVQRCVERCYFSKGEGKGGHYNPLALQVLGEVLGCTGYDAEAWDVRLKTIHDPFDYEMSGKKHSIFSILRTSYDCLSDEAKLFFVDVAIHTSWRKSTRWSHRQGNIFEWLGVVHGLESAKSRLEELKRKSLLEEVGDGGGNIVMHDLWHEFCMAETKAGKLGDGWWVYSEEESREVGESSPGGGCWENLRRMCLVREGWRSLHGVELSEFANVTVLKVAIDDTIIVPSALDLNVSGLRHLRSLELRTWQFFSKIEGLGSLKNLVHLSWVRREASNSACIEEIRHLTKLEVLDLGEFTNAEMPDLSMLTSLREVWLMGFRNAVTVRGLSSKLSKLRILNLPKCGELRDCPGLGELCALEELVLSDCRKLKEVLCLRRLKRLRVLDISGCRKLIAVAGLVDLTALQELRLGCSPLTDVADMWRLRELRVLEFSGLAGIDALDVGVFHRLETISVWFWEGLKSVTCSGPLCTLKLMRFHYCDSLEEMPDSSSFPQLDTLILEGCAGLMSLTSSVPLHSLRFLTLRGCTKLRAVPGSEDQFECTGLVCLDLAGCEELKELPCVRLLTRLWSLDISGCKLLRAVRGLSDLVALESFRASGCVNLGNLPDMRMLTKLEVLEWSDVRGMDSLELGLVPRDLQKMDFSRCGALKSVTCCGSLCAMKEIRLAHCSSLEEVPDLSNFPKLECLDLEGCGGLMSLTSSAPFGALKTLDLRHCGNLTALPNHLSSSENLKELRLEKSGIVLREEDIRNLKASCKSLRVDTISAFAEDTGDSNEELHEMEVQSYKQFLLRRLSNSIAGIKVTSVVYSSTGDSVVALTSEGMHKVWEWRNEVGVKTGPQLRRPRSGLTMINEISDTSREGAVSCMASSKNGSYFISASGGRVSLFLMRRFEMEARLLELARGIATSLAFYPQDNKIIAVGTEDSTILIYQYDPFVSKGTIMCKFVGHYKRITGLAFSDSLSVLVSSGADGQLCMWRTDWWADLCTYYWSSITEVPAVKEPERRAACKGDIRVEFHNDGRQLLVVGESQLAVYDGSTLERLVEWARQSPFITAITDATFSRDGEFVYTSFADGCVGVFDGKSLWPRCRLAQPFYAPREVSRSRAYPMAIAANPVVCAQFAVGMSDGGVLVVEPVEPDGEWSPGSPPGCGAVSGQSHRMMYCCEPTQL